MLEPVPHLVLSVGVEFEQSSAEEGGTGLASDKEKVKIRTNLFNVFNVWSNNT